MNPNVGNVPLHLFEQYKEECFLTWCILFEVSITSFEVVRNWNTKNQTRMHVVLFFSVQKPYNVFKIMIYCSFSFKNRWFYILSLKSNLLSAFRTIYHRILQTKLNIKHLFFPSLRSVHVKWKCPFNKKVDFIKLKQKWQGKTKRVLGL